MTITVSDPLSFVSQHWLSMPAAGKREFWSFTGVAVVNAGPIPGVQTEVRENYDLDIPINLELEPNKVLEVEQWTVLVAPSAIHDFDSTGDHSVFAVDSFGLRSRVISSVLPLTAAIVVQGFASTLFRLHYKAEILGRRAQGPV